MDKYYNINSYIGFNLGDIVSFRYGLNDTKVGTIIKFYEDIDMTVVAVVKIAQGVEISWSVHAIYKANEAERLLYA